MSINVNCGDISTVHSGLTTRLYFKVSLVPGALVTDKIYTDRELALNYLNFCVPTLTSFHAPRKLLWQVSFVVFSVKSIGKTPFESTKINIFAKLLHRSSFWDSNLKGK